ncbi:phosphatase PAP2 family protein [Subsaxibacter sp. CAU 1640]|uniref:phosphatase PAP2 family protein n=1 Tax=Subsaxibacter sp. CAU 1640 TaxID=2933271 RepID=UPI0020063C84|nr:phosphatase PAP2 family protein [Subsaxibacter sp. CAU 1640]MCK7591919.1 phosphatase PAP2 family protein [Subsaxibacter sp. CAU 1640]
MRKALIALLRKLREVLVRRFHQYDVKLPYIITVVIALIVVVGGINLFIELTDTLKSKALADYDFQITEYVISYRSPMLTEYLTFVTHLGDVYGYLIVLVLCSFVFFKALNRWKLMIQSIVVLALASLSNVVLKRFVDRARPDIEHLVVVETLSYPSGHAMAAMAFYGFLSYLVYRFVKNKYLKTGLILLFMILIFSIGISRIYLGVHFPSDIAGGYIAGFIWVIFCILVFDLIEVFRRDPRT